MREMAERTTILRCHIGPTIHGLHLEGQDDKDEMGICVEDLGAVAGFHEFEQYVFRTAAERDGKHDAKSLPGDLDLTIYSLRKYLRLALQGNPTVLTLLKDLHELRDKDLVCWCAPQSCHADILLQVANEQAV